jgi:flagellar hook-basal body complex protein FliE
MAIDAVIKSGASIARGAFGGSSGAAPAPAGSLGGTFADSLGKLIDSVEGTAGDANEAIGNMLDKSGEVHDAMIALQRAEMSLQLTVQIRNKLVQAYQDIMRMPI